MSLGLHTLKVTAGAKKRKRNRVGRGNSSGHGTYSTRGLKGQRSRSGGKSGLKKMGMKMIRQRIPKYKGMKSSQPLRQAINLSTLEKNFNDGDVINKHSLYQKKLIDSVRLPVKILGNGELKKKLDIQVAEFSTAAKNAIEKVGGKIKAVESKK